MNVLSATRTLLEAPADSRRRHRLRITVGATLAIIAVAALSVYGLDYYSLDATGRALSSKHRILRSSGAIGLRLGQLGALMFLGLYLYPIRKRWPWLARQGNSKHWLDVHVLLGVTAPVVIAFHAAFKFQGLAGVAFWIMLAVAVSGVVGRYLYAQSPRSLSAAELSMKECQGLQAELADQLTRQTRIRAADLEKLYRSPGSDRVQRMALWMVLLYMVWLDLHRPLRMAALRRHSLNGWQKCATLGGIFASNSPDLERAVRLARQQAALSKRILFLGRAHQVFQLWHVVHRPFSYSFSVLAAVHIMVALLFGMM
jgi:hypothetical protein